MEPLHARLITVRHKDNSILILPNEEHILFKTIESATQ
jgi:hypothetical protein